MKKDLHGGKNSGYVIVASLDVVQITCTKDVLKSSVTRSLQDPSGVLLSKCCTIKRRVLCVVAELFPLRVTKFSLQLSF